MKTFSSCFAYNIGVLVAFASHCVTKVSGLGRSFEALGFPGGKRQFKAPVETITDLHTKRKHDQFYFTMLHNLTLHMYAAQTHTHTHTHVYNPGTSFPQKIRGVNPPNR